MIHAPGIPGVAFGAMRDGDARTVRRSRRAVSKELGLSEDWATVSQIHSNRVVAATTAGNKGDADGLFTTVPGLPLAVGTADCVPVAIRGSRSIAIVHAGWRGVASAIVTEARKLIQESGDAEVLAAIGPHIGSCCYEVGDEVIAAIGGHEAVTTWGTQSADLTSAITAQLRGIPTTVVERCTMHDDGFASHRENGTTERQISVAWL